MKVHYKLYEILIFIIIFIFCILPPVFTTNQEFAFSTWNFPYIQCCLAIFAIILFNLCKFLRNNLIKKNNFFYSVIMPASFCLALLFFTALIFKIFSMNQTKQIYTPKSFIELTFCIINFLCASIYEEVIYRFYFPQALKRIINSSSIFFIIIVEILAGIVFALAHFYLGFLSIFNAFLAHFILRYFYVKSNNLLCCIIAHCCYNLMVLFLL